MIIRISLLFLSALVQTACGERTPQIEISGQTMGTTYKIVVADGGGEFDQVQVHNVVEATLKSVNESYSNWDPNSEISKFNSQKTTNSVKISIGLASMLRLGDSAYQATGGSFDLTLTPLIELWGFGPSGKVTKRPDDAAILKALSVVGQSRVLQMSDDERYLRKIAPEATVYLTAIAKGYGIDAVADSLRELGAKDFMVEIGGDLYVSGETRRGTPWLIGIERPDAGRQNVEEVLELSNVGMATSGDYRNYFEENGIRYSHIIDGATGYPITHRTASVTVLSETAAKADAWATALLTVGLEPGLRIAAEQNLDVLFIVRQDDPNGDEFEIITTNGFEQFRRRREGD